MRKASFTLPKIIVPNSKNLRIAIVRTSYYPNLNNNLETYCRQTLQHYGIHPKNITTFIAPGSWEIPLITKKIVQTGQYAAIVTFGIIVKGETHHFDMIVNAATTALMQLSLQYGIPIAMEILAVYDLETAQARAGKNNANKGIEGALAVLKTLKTLKEIR